MTMPIVMMIGIRCLNYYVNFVSNMDIVEFRQKDNKSGGWVHSRRKAYDNRNRPDDFKKFRYNMTSRRIKKLDRIGMWWGKKYD
jgi:hypothetical protein